jgi:predicted dehydrogenase
MKVAVLGAGAMGETVISHLKDSKIVTGTIAYDIRSERIKELNSKGISATDNLEKLLDDKEIRLVFVTASNDVHKDLTIRSLEAGKAVMCEKPMALTLSDAEAMVNKAEELKGFLQIGFELRYSKLYTKVKEWIDKGLLGKIVNTNCCYIASAWEKTHGASKTERAAGCLGKSFRIMLICRAGGLVPKWLMFSVAPLQTPYLISKSGIIITQLTVFPTVPYPVLLS